MTAHSKVALVAPGFRVRKCLLYLLDDGGAAAADLPLDLGHGGDLGARADLAVLVLDGDLELAARRRRRLDNKKKWLSVRAL